LHSKHCITLKLRHTAFFLISQKQAKIEKNHPKTLSTPKGEKIKNIFLRSLAEKTHLNFSLNIATTSSHVPYKCLD
jgi:hypothetical protein